VIVKQNKQTERNHVSVFSLNGELAYEFLPTTNDEILQIDAVLNDMQAEV
jgi:hypothetical protein